MWLVFWGFYFFPLLGFLQRARAPGAPAAPAACAARGGGEGRYTPALHAWGHTTSGEIWTLKITINVKP